MRDDYQMKGSFFGSYPPPTDYLAINRCRVVISSGLSPPVCVCVCSMRQSSQCRRIGVSLAADSRRAVVGQTVSDFLPLPATTTERG